MKQVSSKEKEIKTLTDEKESLSFSRKQKKTRTEKKIRELNATGFALQNKRGEHENRSEFFQNNSECPSCEQSITESTTDAD